MCMLEDLWNLNFAFNHVSQTSVFKCITLKECKYGWHRVHNICNDKFCFHQEAYRLSIGFSYCIGCPPLSGHAWQPLLHIQVANLASKMELKGMKLFRTILLANLSRTEELHFLLEVKDFCLHLGLHVGGCSFPYWETKPKENPTHLVVTATIWRKPAIQGLDIATGINTCQVSEQLFSGWPSYNSSTNLMCVSSSRPCQCQYHLWYVATLSIHSTHEDDLKATLL
jgi:hypothetical protein